MKEEIDNIYDWLETAGHKFGDKNKVSMAVGLVEEETKELKEAIEADDEEQIKDALVDLFWVCQNVAYFYGIYLNDLMKYADNVSESNWSKFCETEGEAMQSVEAYRAGEHPASPGIRIDSDYTKVGTWYVVKRHDGKVLKSINYKNLL